MEIKNRDKYPGIRYEEDFEKLAKMLFYQKIIRIIGLLLILLLIAVISLARIISNEVVTLAFFIIPLVGFTALVAFLNTKIDKEFIARAKKAPITHREILNKEVVFNTYYRDFIKKKKRDFVTLFIFMAICCGIGVAILINDESYQLLYSIIGFFAVVVVIDLLIKLVSITKRKKRITTVLDSSEYKMLKVMLTSKTYYEGSSDDNPKYSFLFDCNEYGTLEYNTTQHNCLCAQPLKDVYYLLITPKKNKNQYEIVEAFNVDEWSYSGEFGTLTQIEYNTKVVPGKEMRNIDTLAVEKFDGDIVKALEYLANNPEQFERSYLEKLTSYEYAVFKKNKEEYEKVNPKKILKK